MVVYTLANLAVILAFATLGVLRCRTLFLNHPALTPRTMPKHARHLFGLLPIPLILFSLNSLLEAEPDWQWNMPFWLQLHYNALSWCVIIAVVVYVFAFSIATYFLARNPWKKTVLPAAICVLGVFEVFAWSNLRARPPRLREPQISRDGVILQTTYSTCAAAAAANIAAHLGIPKTERDFAELFGTTDEGTLASQIVAGLRKAGFVVTKRNVRDSDIKALKPPAMLFIVQDTHAVAFLGMTNGLAEIWDPLAGRRLLKRSFLRESWSGHALEIRLPKEQGTR